MWEIEGMNVIGVGRDDIATSDPHGIDSLPSPLAGSQIRPS